VHTFAETHNATDKFFWVGGQAFLEDPEDFKKIAWKKVAELIKLEGCYLYGNSTTKDKYKEIRKLALARMEMQ
jgi:hypothetical protein